MTKTIDTTAIVKVQCANPICCLFIPKTGSLVHPTGLHACDTACARTIDALLVRGERVLSAKHS